MALSEPAEVKHTLLRFSCLAIDLGPEVQPESHPPNCGLPTVSSEILGSYAIRVQPSAFPREQLRSNSPALAWLKSAPAMLRLILQPMAAARPVCRGKLFKMN